jgi:aconitate hydratase
VFGPNIKDWPTIPPMPEHLLLRVISFITDEVTTTDELIPSGETSSFRSNPLRLAEFALGRRDPAYVGKAKALMALNDVDKAEKAALFARAGAAVGLDDCGSLAETAGLASAIYARKPGDGSAREQAASSQRVLGGGANFALEYATKRYRSNLINWGILPFLTDKEDDLAPDTWVFLPHIRRRIGEGAETVDGFRLELNDSQNGAARPLVLKLGALTDAERDILLAGCLINYYRR